MIDLCYNLIGKNDNAVCATTKTIGIETKWMIEIEPELAYKIIVIDNWDYFILTVLPFIMFMSNYVAYYMCIRKMALLLYMKQNFTVKY